MNRRFSFCDNCDRLWRVRSETDEHVHGYFCASQEMGPVIAMRLNDGIHLSGGTLDEIAVDEKEWERLEIPKDCTFLADIVLTELNK